MNIKRLVFSMLMCAACTPRSFHQGGATPQHTWIGTAQLPDGPFWLDFTADLMAGSPLAVDMLDDTLLPREDGLTRLVDDWVVRIDRTLRESGKIPVHIPAPRGYVVIKESANAFNPLLRQCLNLSVTPVDPVNIPVEEGGEIRAEISVGEIEPTPERQIAWRSPECRPPTPAEVASVAQAVARFSPVPGCTASLQGNGIKMSRDCYREVTHEVDAAGNPVVRVASEPQFWRADRISILKSVNAVVINTGLIARMPKQEMVVAIIGHELAHYYRAHGASLHESPEFWYRDADRPLPQTPQRVERAGELAALAQAMDAPLPHFPKAEGQVLGTVAWSALKNIGDNTRWVFAQNPIPPLCQEAAAFFQQQKALSKLMSREWYPQEFQLRGPLLGVYQAYEAKVQACLQPLPASPETVSRLLISSPVEPERLPAPAHLWDALLKMEVVYNSDVQQRIRLLNKAKENRLGFYTTEQEADEFGMQILATAARIPPHFELEGQLALGSWYTHVGYDDFQLCHRKARQNWKKPDGTWEILIPLETREAHHDSCYRAYNLARELEAHPEYGAGDYLTLPAETWWQMREKARKAAQE